MSSPGGGYKLVDKILSDNWAEKESAVPERTSFNTIYPATSSDTRTFFKTNNAEFGETVYYYAGNATNNWVIFGSQKEDSTGYIGYNNDGTKRQYFNTLSSCQSHSTYNNNCDNLYHSGDDLYWRIIRTNEESTGGGIRLLYSGSGLQLGTNDVHQIKAVQNGYIGYSNWYNSPTIPNNIGYTRATATYTAGETTLAEIRGTTKEGQTNSNIKTLIDNYYKATFENTNYEVIIDTKAVYCNDRSGNTTMNAGIYFGAYSRLKSRRAPSYACGAKITGYDANDVWYYTGGNDSADRYSADGPNEEYNFGNGFLDYPIALATADEIAFAGGYNLGMNINAWYYLNANTSMEATYVQKSATGLARWWTMTPSHIYENGNYAYIFYVDNAGIYANNNIIYSTDFYGMLRHAHPISHNSVERILYARPVLSLNSTTMWSSGDGTASNPYRIVEN